MTAHSVHARTTVDRPDQRSTADLIRVGLVVLFAILQAVSSLLANLLPGEQASTGDISDRYAHVLTPAGYAFAIWGLIYFASLALALYQALPAQHTRAVHRATGWWIAGAFAASTVWVPIFVSEALGLAQVVIVALVVLLAVALARLTRLGPAASASERWLLRMPVSAYLGWATIATVAGTGTTALWAGVEFTAGIVTVTAVVALLVLAGLAAWIGARVLAAAGFAGLLAWGLVAVAVGTSQAAVAVAAACAAVVAVAAVALRAARSQDRTAVLFG